MHSRSTIAVTLLAGSVAALPVGQSESGSLPGYSDANAPFVSSPPSPYTISATTFGLDSQISAVATTAPAPGQPGAADTLRSDTMTGPTSHGPYSGTPTTTGAVSNSPTGATIPVLPPNPTATYYNSDGELQHVQPAPYVPYGGLGTNGTEPRYM